MNWLRDTNVVSELTKAKPDGSLLAWLKERRGRGFLSTITLSELRYGIERLTDSRRRAELERAFAFLLEDYQGRFLIWTGTSRRNGDVMRRHWRRITARAGMNSLITGTRCWRRRRGNSGWGWRPGM